MGTAINHAAAIKRLEALFSDVNLDKSEPKPLVKPLLKPVSKIHFASPTPIIIPTIEVEVEHDRNCDVHGKNGSRRGSLGNILHAGNKRDPFAKGFGYGTGTGVGPRRDSLPTLSVPNYYRYCIVLF